MSEAKSSTNIKNGWVKEDNQWYYYEDNKKLNTQWIQSKSRYYYLEKDGYLVKGWFQTSKNNEWYYAFSEETINNDKIFYEGEICTGWLKLNDKWYFFEDVNDKKLGVMYCDGIFKIKGKYHKFDRDGVWIEEVFSYEINNNVTVLLNNTISDELCDFISYFEGCRLNAYHCSSGILTIGIGCTRKEATNLGTITKERAYEEFKKDILIFVKAVDILCSNYNVRLKNMSVKL